MEKNSTKVGREGEGVAKRFLLDSGYEIIAANWRFRHYEVDLIAKKDEKIVFVEVKTRKNDAFGEPELFVSKKKQKFMIASAHEFMTQNSLNLESRFDIIAISNLKEKIVHIEGAFFPTIQ